MLWVLFTVVTVNFLIPAQNKSYEWPIIYFLFGIFASTALSKLIAEKINADWSTVLEGYLRDGRIGHSHVNVPGHDGKKGFGGSCFPKDIQAMINFSKVLGVDSNVLKGAWKTNLKVRPEQDWKKLKGRAVTINKEST